MVEKVSQHLLERLGRLPEKNGDGFQTIVP